MADGDTTNPAAFPVQPFAATTPRLAYEKPALMHLGSVNRLTLAVSKQPRSDGIRTKPRAQTG
jgi:hypothetical protein